MLLVAAALRDSVPTAVGSAQSHWWAWSGGLFGAVYIAISIALVPRIGAANFLALLVAGQMLGSLLFDHFGLFGIPQHEINAVRILGALLLVGGVVLVRF